MNIKYKKSKTTLKEIIEGYLSDKPKYIKVKWKKARTEYYTEFEARGIAKDYWYEFRNPFDQTYSSKMSKEFYKEHKDRKVYIGTEYPHKCPTCGQEI